MAWRRHSLSAGVACRRYEYGATVFLCMNICAVSGKTVSLTAFIFVYFRNFAIFSIGISMHGFRNLFVITDILTAICTFD